MPLTAVALRGLCRGLLLCAMLVVAALPVQAQAPLKVGFVNVGRVLDKAPQAEAILINGMCNFRTGPDGLPQRPLHLADQLEATLGKPVVGHDIALYWRIFKSLGIAPEVPHGQLLSRL